MYGLERQLFNERACPSRRPVTREAGKTLSNLRGTSIVSASIPGSGESLKTVGKEPLGGVVQGAFRRGRLLGRQYFGPTSCVQGDGLSKLSNHSTVCFGLLSVKQENEMPRFPFDPRRDIEGFLLRREDSTRIAGAPSHPVFRVRW